MSSLLTIGPGSLMADSRGRALAAVLDEGPKGGPLRVPVLDEGPKGGPLRVPVLDEGPKGGPPGEWLACRQLSWRFRRVLDPWTSFRPFPPRGVEGEARMKLSVIRFHVGDG